MALKTISRVTNGHARRFNESWIDAFVDTTKGLESAPIWRRWSAISAIGAVLQQKVWVETQGVLFPNLYVFLVGDAGIGKSRPINHTQKIIMKMNYKRDDDKKIGLAPTSTTMASLTDCMAESKRVIPLHPPPALQYNSLFIMADELSAFMSDYKNSGELIAGLTKYYDCSPYSQARRTNKLQIAIEKPQLSILAGSTQSNLLHFIPPWAWDQGFTSRIILVFANERHMVNPFTEPKLVIPDEMILDLENMDTLIGSFGWTDEYSTVMNTWRESGMDPAPDHPRLMSYCSRRWSHMIKLTMISAVDRGNELMLTVEDFKRAQRWMLEAEHYMPEIFRTGTSTADSKAMDDIQHYIESFGERGCPEHMVKNFARNNINVAMIIPTIEAMKGAGMIRVKGLDKIGTQIFEVVRAN